MEGLELKPDIIEEVHTTGKFTSNLPVVCTSSFLGWALTPHNALRRYDVGPMDQ